MALKVLKRLTQDPTEDKRYIETLTNEGRLLSGLSHPRLARILDFSTAAARPYLAMEYIEGGTLRELIDSAGKPCNETLAVRYAKEILEALEYLHTRNPPVVVRDLKPENIMVDKSGSLKLIDFGIARVLTPGSRTHTIIRGFGSEGFSPIEQYGAGTTDVKSDIYALGATLFFAVTGQEPPSAIDRVTKGASIPDLTALLSPISKEFASSIECMMALAPADRPTATELRRFIDAPCATKAMPSAAPATPPPTPAKHLSGGATKDEGMSFKTAIGLYIMLVIIVLFAAFVGAAACGGLEPQ